MAFADLFSTITGSKSSVDVGSVGSATSVPGSSKNVTRVLTPGGTTFRQTEVKQMSNQPGTTPDSASNAQVSLPDDAFRFGNGSIDDSTGDSLASPRTYGDGDDTIASISLTTQTSGSDTTDTSNPALNTPQGDVLSAYSRFFLQNVRETQSEKYQVVETFTAYYVFFYGKRPPVYTFSGTLLNDQNHKWTNDLMFFYENFLRGSQTVSLGSQAIVAYDGRFVSGFLLDLSIQQTGELDKGATFSFDVLVTNHAQNYFSADIGSLISSAAQTLADQRQKIQDQINQINSSIAPGQATLAALQATNGNTRPNTLSIPGTNITVTPPSLAIPTTIPFQTPRPF